MPVPPETKVEEVPFNTKLLAYNGTARNQRQGFLGILLHDKSKWFIRKAVDTLHGKMRKVFEYKDKTGYANPVSHEIKAAFDHVIELDRMPINRAIGGFKDVPGGDQNEKFFLQMRDIVVTQLDEDAHYMLRFMAFLNYVHLNFDKFQRAANQADQILRFGEVYGDLIEELKEQKKALPEDDGSFDDEIDMVELYKRVTGRAP